MTKQTKIVVFTGDLSYSVRKGIVEIDEAVPGILWLILIHSPKRRFGEVLRSQWRNYRRNGWRWIPHQTADIYRRFIRSRTRSICDYRVPGGGFTSTAVAARENLRLLRVADIHSQESLDTVTAFEPDLGLSLAAPILRRPLFSVPKHGTINLHKGKLPDYRGMPPAFWELWNNEKAVGCTVHRVDDRLDTGDIICRTIVERAKFSTVRGLRLQLDEVGVDLMIQAVKNILFVGSNLQRQEGDGKTYRKPTLRQAAALEHRLRRAGPLGASIPKLILETAASNAGRSMRRIGWRHLLTPRISVLLFHRVSDDIRDNLTVGVEQFDRQMALVREYCESISIEQVLAYDVIPRSRRPLVAVTFDDGYRDNYVNAVPILMRHGIPAAFFVSTGMVETNGRFPHDVRRGNPHIPIMTWDQLRDMRRKGFTIGSHTVNHIDCAAEPEQRVKAELERSRDQLHRELGEIQLLFAYPYGGLQNMTAQRLELVKEAGYFGCLSAYGGANVGRVDSYNVRRSGIYWRFSDAAFLIACLGLR